MFSLGLRYTVLLAAIIDYISSIFTYFYSTYIILTDLQNFSVGTYRFNSGVHFSLT